MASIDWGMVGIGALIGVGCRKQLKAAGRIAASTAASLAGVAAQTAASVAKETSEKKAPEQKAAEAKVEEINRKIDQLWNELH